MIADEWDLPDYPRPGDLAAPLVELVKLAELITSGVNEDLTLTASGLVTDGVFARIEIPKPIAWVPHEDITAFELAQAMNVMLLVNNGGYQYVCVEDMIAAMPPNVSRHFKVG